MDTFKQRLPARKDLLPLFAVSAFLIHVWAMYSMFVEVPSLLLRLEIGDFVGAIAYTLMFALIESLAFFCAVLLLMLIVPHTWLRHNTIVMGTFLVLVLQYSTLLSAMLASVGAFITWLVGLACIVGIFYWLMHRGKSRLVVDIVERLTVLTSLYLVLDVVSVAIVIIRNVSR